jgi:beta-glucosidase
VNLARDPRNGRNFEYLGEDPWLAGNLAGASIKGIEDQGSSRRSSTSR